MKVDPTKGVQNPFTFLWTEHEDSENFSVNADVANKNYHRTSEHSSYHKKIFMD